MITQLKYLNNKWIGDKYKMKEELLGDKVEKVLDALGAKKIVKVIEAVTKKPCNCGQRKQALNAIHAKLIGTTNVEPDVRNNVAKKDVP